MESLDLIAKWYVYGKVFEILLAILLTPIIFYVGYQKWKNLF